MAAYYVQVKNALGGFNELQERSRRNSSQLSHEEDVWGERLLSGPAPIASYDAWHFLMVWPTA